MKKVLVFHQTIAPYRIDFFNDIYHAFDTQISLYYRNLKSQTFDYEKIASQFEFTPDYFDKKICIFGREIRLGFVKRIKSKQPDIIMVSEYSESLWISLLYRLFSRNKYKIISISDDSADIVRNEGGFHAKARRIATKYIDGVILCNDAAEKEYKVRYPNVKTCVMPIIQDETRYFKDKESIVNRAKKIAREENLLGKRVFLYVGRIVPEKNLKYLVDSFVISHEKCKDNILLIIGGRSQKYEYYDAEVNDSISKNNASSYIRKLGRCEGDELKAWYYASQVTVLPSIWEPFGAVTNEALLCGNYVMVSEAAGSSYLVNDSNGEIIDVNKSSIDFDKICSTVPLMTEDYIATKASKMEYSYSHYRDTLIGWIGDICYD